MNQSVLVMKLLYLDCFAGISGDMFIGALIDLGVSEERLRCELMRLRLHGCSISTRRVVRQNISAVKFDCHVEHSDQHHAHHHHEYIEQHRGYSDIATLISSSELPAYVEQRALNIFKRIAEAEAKIHGIDLEKVHFHEIGAVDSIIDVVGACVAMELLDIDEVHALPPPLGSGFVETAHGRFPVPAPGTLALLTGIPTQSSTEMVELVTPTGAAILAEFCTSFGPMPTMKIEKVGYGAGTRDLGKTPNVLRAVMGETTGVAENDVVSIIETNIDDMNPQLFGDVMDRLLAAGALEVFMTAVQMKKNRPGTLLTVLCEREDVDRMAELLLSHTTTFGVRVYEAQRRKLARRLVKVPTKFGEIEVKIGELAGKIVSRSPEFESCKRAAETAHVAVKDVYTEVTRVAEETL
jgi:uncharacterized protein (TIGR00299 family) protein